MLIGDKYKIESDSLNITLYAKARSKEPRVTTWRAIAFFSNPKNALCHLVDLKVKEMGLKDFRAIVEKQDELYRLVDSLRGLPKRLESCREPTKDKLRGKTIM